MAASLVAAMMTAVAAAPTPAGAQAEPVVSTVDALTAAPGQMAEATVAIDPARPERVAAAADPYLAPVRIVVTQSDDTGATWGPPLTIIPPGYAKSYDPELAFLSDGRLLVVGGASQVGRPSCQPGSAVFIAIVGAAGVDYRIVRGDLPTAAFVDRPALAVQRGAGGDDRAFVSWTESSGPGAECLAQPGASTTMLTAFSVDGAIAPPLTVPSTGLPAPFGSALAVDASGLLHVAVTEREPGVAARIVVTTMTAGGEFGPLAVVADGPALPDKRTGLGGVVTGTPDLAVDRDGRITVAWSQPAPEGIRVQVADQGPDGSFALSTPPDQPVGDGLFPTLAYSGTTLRLLSASVVGGQVTFELRTRGAGGWAAAEPVATGPSQGYLELGEFLGIAAAPGSLVIAVPVDGPQISRLVVQARLVAPEATTTTTSARAAASNGPRNEDNRAEPGYAEAIAAGALLLATVGLVVGGSALRRRRG